MNKTIFFGEYLKQTFHFFNNFEIWQLVKAEAQQGFLLKFSC